MMARSRKWLAPAVAAALAVALVGGGFLAVRAAFLRTIHDHRVLHDRNRHLPRRRREGLRCQGRHDQGDRAAGYSDQDDDGSRRGVSLPADAQAVIVAQNLIAARYVQLTPAYRSSGPTMATVP